MGNAMGPDVLKTVTARARARHNRAVRIRDRARSAGAPQWVGEDNPSTSRTAGSAASAMAA